jgi:hypothetical protein
MQHCLAQAPERGKIGTGRVFFVVAATSEQRANAAGEVCGSPLPNGEGLESGVPFVEVNFNGRRLRTEGYVNIYISIKPYEAIGDNRTTEDGSVG